MPALTFRRNEVEAAWDGDEWTSDSPFADSVLILLRGWTAEWEEQYSTSQGAPSNSLFVFIQDRMQEGERLEIDQDHPLSQNVKGRVY